MPAKGARHVFAEHPDLLLPLDDRQAQLALARHDKIAVNVADELADA